jgi:hypothetical protein
MPSIRWENIKKSLSSLTKGKSSKQQMQKPIFSVENQSGPHSVNTAMPTLHREPTVEKLAITSEKVLGSAKSFSSGPQASHKSLEKKQLTRASTMAEGKEAMLSQVSVKSHGHTPPAQKKNSWWQPSAEQKEKADRFNRQSDRPHSVRGRSAEAEAKSQGYYR